MSFIMMLRTGLISLAISAFFGLGAYASALLVTKSGMSFWLSLPASVLMVSVVALIVGAVCVRNAGFTFLLITMVFGMLIPVTLGNISIVGGYSGISPIPPPNPITIPFLARIVFMSKTPYYYLIMGLVLIVIVAFWALYSSWLGEAWRAIGLTESLAKSVGIDVYRHRLLTFVIASGADALAGAFYASYVGTVTPIDMGVFKSIYVHIYAILGGVEFAVLGPMVGSFIMTFVPEFLRIARDVEPIITGVFMMLLILLLPRGVLGLMLSTTAAARPSESIAGINRILMQWLMPKRRHEGGRGAGNQRIE
jgi:branched-chain amino acid transport system permease protein